MTKLRILIASEDIPNPHLGGLGKHALNLAHALARRGHAVDLLGNGKHPVSSLPDQQGPGQFFGELNGFERGWKQQRLGLFHAYALRANAKPVREAILRHAAAYDVVHYHGHLPWVAADLPANLPFVQTRHDQGGDCMLKTRYLAVGASASICRSIDPADCARCATPKPGSLQALVSKHAVRAMRDLTRQAYVRHSTVFVSGFLKRNFERAAGVPIPGCVIPNAVDTRQLKAVAQNVCHAREEAAGLRLFTAGAMFAYKGFGPLLEALRSASSQSATRRNYVLRLAGAGPLEQELRRTYGDEHTQFLGWQAYSSVVAEVLAADAVLVPSVWEEPCATSILEALALGKTVYALAQGGTPEMTAYAASAGGCLRTYTSLEELAYAALRHEARVQPLSAGTIDHFENSVELMAERVEAVYRGVIENKAGLRE